MSDRVARLLLAAIATVCVNAIALAWTEPESGLKILHASIILVCVLWAMPGGER